MNHKHKSWFRQHQFPHIALLPLVLIGLILAALVVAPGKLSGVVTFLELQGASRHDGARDVNGNGVGDVVDIQATAAQQDCHVYLPVAVANWRQPWSTADLTFVPDSGFRVENASNPAPSVDPETGTVHLFYADRSSSPPRNRVTTSSDGLNFSAGRQPTEQDNPHHPFYVHLPDGTWRRYLFDPASGLKSESSADGIHYTPDPGVRYTLQPSDNGMMGVRNVYVDPSGGVVLLYVGDMGGVNNVRRAYSPPGDNGWTFIFEDDNVLGDADAGGKGYSYVDPKSILLPDGRRRLFTMRQGPAPPQPGVRATGTIYSFISDDGKNYTLEPGVRLAPDDFREFDVWSLNDPMVVRLPDGRYRMYVAALVTDGSGDAKWVIVSATTAD